VVRIAIIIGSTRPSYVVDAVGGRSQTAHRTAIERLAHAGAVPNTALSADAKVGEHA
jgi:hypothetical protein